MSEKNNNYNNNINNIGIIPSNKEFMNINQLNNNASLQLNNYNNLSPYIDSNLNFNNLLLLNSNKNISNINLNNSNRQDIDNNNFKNNTQNNIPYNNIQNNYFNNPNKNYYQQGNNTKQMKIFQKPYNLRDNYLKEFYNPKGEKILYNLFKYDLNIYRNSKDKIYQLFQIFEIVKDKLNNKDREENNYYFQKEIKQKKPQQWEKKLKIKEEISDFLTIIQSKKIIKIRIITIKNKITKIKIKTK